MRNLKKFLALLLAVMMVATSAVIASAEEATDYTEAAEVLVSTGVLKGYTDGDLHLEDDVQRYQMALFIARMMTGDVNDTLWSNINTTSFTDIGKLSQYVGAISFVTGEGVIKGRSETIFDPYAQITYQEAVTMLVRALGYQNLSYPYGFIQAANKIGLTSGIEGVEWAEPLTRGEVAQLLYNTIKFVSDFGTGDGSYAYEGDHFEKFDTFAIVDAYIADYNAEAGYVKFSSGDQATFEKLGIEEPSDEILGSWYELFMLEDKVIKIDACEVVDAEADSYMDPAGEEIDEEDLDDDYVVVTVYETRENGKVGVVKVSSYIAGEAPAIGYTYTAGQKSTKVDVALEWETYRVVSLKDGKAALKVDGDKESKTYTYDYGTTLNGIKTAEEIEAVLTEALKVGGVVSVVIYEDTIIDVQAGAVENPIILIVDVDSVIDIVNDDDEFTGFLSADVYSDAFQGKQTIEISAITFKKADGAVVKYDYNEVFDPNAKDDTALQKATQKAIVELKKSGKYIFTGTKDQFGKWTLKETTLHHGYLEFVNDIGKAQIKLYNTGDYDKIGGKSKEWTLDTSKTKTSSAFYNFDGSKESITDALTGKTYSLSKDVKYYIIKNGKISSFVGQPSKGEKIVGGFVYSTLVSDSNTVIVVADAETDIEIPKQYVTSEGVYGRWTRKFEDNKYVYYYKLYGLVDYVTEENIVLEWKADRDDLDILEDMVEALNDKICDGALYTINYEYGTDEIGGKKLIDLVEMTLADYWEDYDIYPYAEANVKSRDFDEDKLEAALGIDITKVRKFIFVDDLTIGLLYDIGFEYDAKTGYLYIYPTEVGAQIVYDKINNNTNTYYNISEVKYNGLVYGEVSVADGGYVRYGHKIVLKELPETKEILTAPGVTEEVDFYTIGANPDKAISGKFYVSKGAGEHATVEFALTGGKATVAYSPKVDEVKAVPSTADVDASSPAVAEEKTTWLQDVYKNNTITKKELYRYLVWDTSNYKDVSVSYQRIVPTIIPGTVEGGGYKINYRFETVNVKSWDIISPYDYVVDEYALYDGDGETVEKKDLGTSYIKFNETEGVVTSAEGVVYAYGKVAANGTFIQYSKADYDAQFKANSTELKDDLKGKIGELIRAYEISFVNGPVTLNVTNSNGKNVNVDLFFIKAYDKVDGKYILIDYNKTIVGGSVDYTIKATLTGGKEYVAPSNGTTFDAGLPATYIHVLKKVH